jgi:beta-galactosidase
MVAAGIFRDITVLSRPRAMDDLWLRTEYSPDGTGSIDPEIIAGERGISDRDRDSRARRPAALHRPSDWRQFRSGGEPWSAEVRRLYDARVSSAGETLRLRLGFRRVEIAGDISGQRQAGDLPRREPA